ncbi:MAG: hypothetical protein ACRDL7_06690, partial [Gaiellaceae bacterium]
ATSDHYRLHFPNGLMSLANMSADEVVSLMFMTLILIKTVAGRNALLNGVSEEKLSAYKLRQFGETCEMLLGFLEWLSSPTGYWKLGAAKFERRATKMIQHVITEISTNFQRPPPNGWNLPKMHKLLHIPSMIVMFGSPANYDSASCERMHKDIAKKPGRLAQKRHETFVTQSAQQLAERHLLDFAHRQLLPNEYESEEAVEETARPTNSTAGGSKFALYLKYHILGPRSNTNITFRVSGVGAFHHIEQWDMLYPDLIQFIADKLMEFENYPQRPSEEHNINCATEYVDAHGVWYRCHPNFRQEGAWNDWAMISYEKPDSAVGFVDVPAKLLCFIIGGFFPEAGDNTVYAICHPCDFYISSGVPKDQLFKRWNMTKWELNISTMSTLPCPYEIVNCSAINGKCFMVPDMEDGGVVYEVLPKDRWADMFARRWKLHENN